MTAPRTSQKASPGDLLIVIHEFAARSPDEITLHKGDRVELIERDDDFNDGWYLGRHIPTDQTGLFPEVYTVRAPQSSLAARAAAATQAQALQDQSAPKGAAAAAPNTSSVAPVSNTMTPEFSTPYGSRKASQSHDTAPLPAANLDTSAVPATDSTRRPPGSGRDSNQGSAVMNETLSVIDEHITDMRKPSRGHAGARDHVDTASEYSGAHSVSRLSYIQGSESEAEEEATPTEKQVMQWSPQRVAEYLEDNGVEKRHCDVFREQEISGEVVLTMDQATLFMKELDLGPIGRRLKTWQRIRALQDAVKSRSTPTGSATDSPRASRPSHQSPRPSAASVRSLGHARRQSSIDQAITASPVEVTPTSAHTQQSSLDRGWTMINPNTRSNSQNLQPRPDSTAHASSLSADTIHGAHSARASQLSLHTPGSGSLGGDGADERGYVSSADPEGRQRRVLHKKKASGHDRNASAESGRRRLSFFGKKSRNQSPARAATNVEAENGPAESPVIGMDGVSRQMDTNRVTSEPGMDLASGTRYEDMGTQQDAKAGGTRERSATVTSGGPVSSGRRGLRAISDAITGKERSLFKSHEATSTTSPTLGSHSPRSSTLSGASKSFDYDDANQSQYSTSTAGPTAPPRRKDKKQTSAYLRGLEKKSPAEQMQGCDYSGWMKKKSSNLMTNWKPRLFVLRGRRLSYYYSDADDEEKGLIDISGHRVLSADNERLTGLHASLTGATSSPTSPQLSAGAGSTFGSPTTAVANGDAATTAMSPMTPGSAAAAAAATTPKDAGPGFIFKLVPPRSGMSKAVNFTRPTVHYFAVPSVEEGRLWMAALMKATIDRDETIDVVTTYQQKTISLAKARARKERPPALRNLEEEEDQAAAGGEEQDEFKEAVEDIAAVSPVDAPDARGPPAVPPKDVEAPPQHDRVAATSNNQITEVTDLESPASPRSAGSLRTGKRRSSARRTNSHGSGSGNGAGLGIDGLSEKSESPVLTRMNSAGMW